MARANSKHKKGVSRYDDASAQGNRSDERGQAENLGSFREIRGQPSPSDFIQSQNPESARRSTPVFESQEALATQLPPRPPSRASSANSIRSQDVNVAEAPLAMFESQEVLATQFPPQKSPRHLPSMALSGSRVTDAPNNGTPNNGRALLRHLQSGNNTLVQQKEHTPPNSAPSATPRSDFTIKSLLNPIDVTENTKAELAAAKLAEAPGFFPGVNGSINSSHAQISLAQNSVSPSQSEPCLPVSPQKKSAANARKRSKSQMADITDESREATSLATSVKASIEPTNIQPIEPPRKRHRSDSAPWAGMTKISRRDVKIPKDQEELFDSSSCWIPADVGLPTPRGHVPPGLLQEWNTKMTRKKETIASPKQLESTSQQEVDKSPSPSHFILQSEDESESESSSQASWSVSPPHHFAQLTLPPDKLAAPPSSSPAGQQTFSRIAGTPSRKKPNKTKIVDTNDDNNDVNGLSVVSQKTSTSAAREPKIVGEENEDDDLNISTNPSPTDAKSKACENVRVEVDEPSDESDMEVSIPRALDASVQEDITSQIEESETADPAPSNSSSAPPDRVQILNTQSSGINRAKKRENGAHSPVKSSTAPQSSSDGNKSSSQVIANSVDSNEDSSLVHENEQATTHMSLVADSQNPNGEYHHSSIPSHQDSQRIPDIVPNSSISSTGLQTQENSQDDGVRDEATQRSSMASAAVTPAVTSKRNAENLELHESPSKRRKHTIAAHSITTKKPVEIAAGSKHSFEDKHRHTFDITPEGPLRVFEIFKKAYPTYTGDFTHFESLCFKLQSLRIAGRLQNYILWDDFIMKHIVDYGNHVQKCVSAGKHWEDYEDYFCANFTKPSFKKRSLVPHTLDVVVSKSDALPFQEFMIDTETQTNLAHPINTSMSSHEPLMIDASVQASLKSQQTSSVRSNVALTVSKSSQATFEDQSNQPGITRTVCTVNGGTQLSLEIPMSPPNVAQSSMRLEDENMIIDETQQPAITTSDDIESEIDEEMDTENHEMASQELGKNILYDDDDDSNRRDSKAQLIARIRQWDREAAQALFNAPLPQPRRDPFLHESDTPLRSWARADQNLVSERRRRGGWRVPCDENGNIVVEEYPRDGWENGRPTRGWAWQPSKNYS